MEESNKPVRKSLSEMTPEELVAYRNKQLEEREKREKRMREILARTHGHGIIRGYGTGKREPNGEVW